MRRARLETATSIIPQVARALGVESGPESNTAQVTAQVFLRFCQELRSSQEIMAHLNLRHWKTFHTNYLKPLLNAGFWKMTIPDKPNSRLQKYRLTATGKRLTDREGAGHGKQE